MTAGIMCRRFAGRSCRAAAFSTTTQVWKRKIFPRKTEECQSTKERDKEPKPSAVLQLWKPPEYRVSFNPSAYPGAKCVYHENASEGLEGGMLESDYGRIGAKQVRNTYSITCSRRLSSTKNTLLDLENNKVLSPQAFLKQPTRLVPMKDDRETANVEDYDTKEDPRTFQKQRPEYGSLCYSRYELPEPLSMEECHNILQKVAILKSSLKPGAIADYFLKLSCLTEEQRVALMSNTRFAMLCRYGVENIQVFDISELIAILRAFVGLAIPPTNSMLNVYETECCRRAWSMNLDQQLLVADLWRCLGRVVPRYLEIMLSYVNLHWKDLTLPQLVQLAYLIGEGRKAPEELVKKLDVLILKYLDSLSLEEVGAICLGFFKSQNGVSEQTMRKIGDKVSAHMADISNYALVNVLKMFRFTHVDHVDFLKQLGNTIPTRIPTIGIQGVMHITLACSALHYLNEKLMNAVAASVPPRAAYCRSKDIAKLLWSFGSLNYEPPNAEEFYTSLEDQVHTKLREFDRFPEHLLTCLLALAFAKRFPLDLINYALSPKFLKLSSSNKFDLHRDFFTLDGTVEIECPGYVGHRLPPQFRQEAAEMLWTLAQKEISMKEEVTEALSLLQDMLGGPHYIKHHMILPHTRSTDFEIHLGCDQKPLPFNSEAASTVKLELKENGVVLTDDLMSQIVKGKPRSQSIVIDTEDKVDVCLQKRATLQEQSLATWDHFSFANGVPLTEAVLDAVTQLKTPSKDPLPLNKEQNRGVKLAVQVSHRNHYCYGSKHLLGLHSLKRRQLSRIGYVVIEIPFWEWFPLLRRNRSEKLSYLHYKVFGSLL